MKREPDGEWEILAADQRLSDSIIWDIQRQYFLKAGPAAWQENVVPHHISCNPIMAASYCDLIWAYLLDIQGELDQSQPIYMIELGAGSGRLTYHLLLRFFDRLDNSPSSPLTDYQFLFVMTDFVPETLSFWQNHPHFQRWIETNRLDFAHFDALAPKPLFLNNQQTRIDRNRLSNPPVIIANYFFDSIPQDSFSIEAGEMAENRLSVMAGRSELDFSDPGVWAHLELRFEGLPLAGPPYSNETYNEILELYEANLPDTNLYFPNIGLDTVDFWYDLAGGKLLLLSSDRGYALPDSLIARPEPSPNLHGSFSLMVNYHAISLFVEWYGGVSFIPPHYQDNLQVVAFVFGEALVQLERFETTFQRAIVERGPNEMFVLYQLAEVNHHTLSLQAILNLLRISYWDAALLQLLWTHFKGLVQTADDIWHADVVQSLAQVLKQYLPLKQEDPFQHEIKKVIDSLSK